MFLDDEVVVRVARNDDAPARCCAPLRAPDMSHDQATVTAAVFKALSDPHRIRIISLLSGAEGQVCVCDLTEPLGLAQATVSHHLKKLLDAGLLQREQHGRWAYYALDQRAMDRLVEVVMTDLASDLVPDLVTEAAVAG